MAKGVRWAVDHGARVINLSLGGNRSSAPLAAALDYAFAKDVVVVACTGNTSASTDTEVWYPAREHGVLAVAGMERAGDVLRSSSITGSQTVITAPATQLVAAPAATGRCRAPASPPPWSPARPLIRSRWPTMPAGEVINRIIRTAKDRGPAGRDATYGFGMVDQTAALTAEVPAVVNNPSAPCRHPASQASAVPRLQAKPSRPPTSRPAVSPYATPTPPAATVPPSPLPRRRRRTTHERRPEQLRRRSGRSVRQLRNTVQ